MRWDAPTYAGAHRETPLAASSSAVSLRRNFDSCSGEIRFDFHNGNVQHPAARDRRHAWRRSMGESRNRNVVARHRRWYVGLVLAVPLTLAVSQSWVAHATAPTQSAFTPITPVRALDSRFTPSMHLSPGHETDVWEVTGGSIPSGATAIVL